LMPEPLGEARLSRTVADEEIMIGFGHVVSISTYLNLER